MTNKDEVWRGQFDGKHFRVVRELRRKGFKVETFEGQDGSIEMWRPIYNMPEVLSILEMALYETLEAPVHA